MENQGNEEGRKLRVGFLSYYPPTYGGATRLATRLASHLTTEGHEAHFIGYDTDFNPAELRRKGIKLHRVERIDLPATSSQPYTWTLASRLHAVHAEVNFDVVHVHYGIPYAISAFLAQSSSRSEGRDFPYVITGHGTDIHTYGKHPDLNPMIRLAFENADALTYVGEGLRELAERDYDDGGLGIKKKGKVVKNFVETERFFPQDSDLRAKLGIPEDAFVLGHVSNFSPIKQTHYFSRVAEELKRLGELDGTYFLLCGSGDLKDRLERDVSVKGLSDHFRFTGKLESDALRLAYSTMDFSALVSKREGCPLAVLESWACGTPVIGTRVEGIAHTIDDGVTGFLFNQEFRSADVYSDDVTQADVREFLNILRRVKNNKLLVKRMSDASFKYAVDNHSTNVVVGQYLDIYRDVIRNHNRVLDKGRVKSGRA